MRLAAATALALAAAGAPALAGEPPAAPREVASAFFAALHRLDAEGAAAHATGPEVRRTLSALVKLLRAYAALEAALETRFGPAGARGVGYRAKVEAEDASLRGAREEIDGDRARVRAGDGRVVAALARVKGAWKVDLRSAENLAEGTAALERDAEGTRRAAAEVARRLAAGDYRGEDEALEDFRDRAEGATRDLPWPGERSL